MKSEEANNDAIRPFIIGDYVTRITHLISEKYGFELPSALRRFLNSKTWTMLNTPKLEMWEYCPDVIFEMWECECISGDPRNSVYLRA